MNCSTPDFPVFHYLPEFAQIHVHWFSDARESFQNQTKILHGGLSESYVFFNLFFDDNDDDNDSDDDYDDNDLRKNYSEMKKEKASIFSYGWSCQIMWSSIIGRTQPDRWTQGKTDRSVRQVGAWWNRNKMMQKINFIFLIIFTNACSPHDMNLYLPCRFVAWIK